MGTEQRMRRVLFLVLNTDKGEWRSNFVWGDHSLLLRCPHTGGVVEESAETEQRMREFLLGFQVQLKRTEVKLCLAGTRGW